MPTIQIPLVSVIAVDSTLSSKTLALPAASTVRGTSLTIKDNFGHSGTNPIILTTTGLDTIDFSNVSNVTLSQNYGAWNFTNDGSTRWMLSDYYSNNLTFYAPRFTLVQESNMISRLLPSGFSAETLTWSDEVSGVSDWTTAGASYITSNNSVRLNSGYVYHAAAITGLNATVQSAIIIYNRLGNSPQPWSGYAINNSAVLYQIHRDIYTADNEIAVYEGGMWNYDSSASQTPGLNFAASSNPVGTTGRYIVGFVQNGTSGTLYLNGSNNGSSSSSSPASTSNWSYCIGSDYREPFYGGPPGYLNAEILFWGLWNVALTATDMSNFYTSNVGRL